MDSFAFVAPRPNINQCGLPLKGWVRTLSVCERVEKQRGADGNDNPAVDYSRSHRLQNVPAVTFEKQLLEPLLAQSYMILRSIKLVGLVFTIGFAVLTSVKWVFTIKRIHICHFNTGIRLSATALLLPVSLI